MKRDARLLIVISLIAVVARLGFLHVFGGLDNDIHDSMADQKIYLQLAHNLANGRGFMVDENIWIADAGSPTSIIPPLYPLFLAGTFRVFGESLVAVRLLQILLSLVVVQVAYALGAAQFNRRIGVMAAFVCALYPPLVMYVRPVMSENLFFALIALLILTTHHLSQPRPRFWLYAVWGILAGLAVLTRTEALLLAGLMYLYLIICRFPRASTAHLAAFAISVLTFAVVLTPYGLYNQSVHGSFSVLPNARWKFWDHTWMAYHYYLPEWANVEFPERVIVPDWETKTEIERDLYLWDVAVRFAVENPGEYLKQRIQRLLGSYPVLPREEFAPPFGTKGGYREPTGRSYGPTSLADYVFYDTPLEKMRVWIFRGVMLLAVGGAVLAVRKRYGYLLFIVVLWNVIDSVLFVGSERIRLQIDPYLILLAATLVETVWLRMTTRVFESPIFSKPAPPLLSSRNLEAFKQPEA